MFLFCFLSNFYRHCSYKIVYNTQKVYQRLISSLIDFVKHTYRYSGKLQ